MEEAKDKKVVFTFGRFQPPTSGHQLLIERVQQVAKKLGAEHRIYPSPSHDAKKNPLSHSDKVKYMKKMFKGANIMNDKKMINPFKVAEQLSEQGYTHVTMVVGSDRVNEFKKSIGKYVGPDGYNFKFNVVSAGKRDPDAEGVVGMSGSKMRQAVKDGDLASFSKGVPSGMNKRDIQGLFKAIKKGMGLKERKIISFVEHEEYQQFEESRKIQSLVKKLSKVPSVIKKIKNTVNTDAVKVMAQLAAIPAVSRMFTPDSMNKANIIVNNLRSMVMGEEKKMLKEPEVLDKLVQKLMDKGMEKNKAYAIATSQLQKQGVLKKGTHDLAEKVYKDSGLGKWFGAGGKGGVSKGGWDRYNTKGERIGKCGDAKPGEGKPKCLSKAKADKLRKQGGKKAIANAVKRKKAKDPQTDRPGTGNKPINVSNRIDKDPKKKGIQDEKNPRIPRKKGQPANSKKHSDLYTDENPKGTIHGLGFKDVKTAEASVAKIKRSDRSHAHKIQAAIAMEQRAREMGKTSEAAVYRKYINAMKKKTKEKNEETKMKSFNSFINEKNVPNDPGKWAASKAAAKAKFDVYPSAYANAWAAKDYKKKGGTWRKAKEEVEVKESYDWSFLEEEGLPIMEAEYQGKKVKLNDPIRTSEVPSKKFKVYVKDGDKVKVVRFGDPNMEIKRDDPNRRKNFRARHNCDNPGPKTKARYWSCIQWRAGASVDN